MNPIDVVDWMRAGALDSTVVVVPLAQRVRDAAGGEPVPLPEPIEEPEDPARVWAKQIFMEKIFYGEEEENGIPSLTIDL